MEWPNPNGEMAGIEHRMVSVNGINMHVAEKGEGPVVLLLHGFPELCYSWRHQIVALAAHGYRAVAPDLRGFGDTDAPPAVPSYTMFHVVGDLVALIDSLGQDQVFVVGHDWGALVAWNLCMFRPDKVRALVNMSVVFRPRHPGRKPVEILRAAFGDDYYVCAFQEPGKTESEFAHIGSSLVIKKFLTYHDPGPAIVPKELGFAAKPEKEITLPAWLSEEDIDYYASKFEKSGFTGGLNYYRALDLNWELMAPWTGVQVKVPVKFIVGDQDLAYHFPGVQDYISNGGFKRDVPLLEDLVVMEGAGHFINQEKPQETSDLIIEFFKKF
ncbi:bifunctional epoxide hydrolase 2-like [Canna indica]|uniref:soluble epoxide hydrolase n=1 Tax=Canna indica TaxID=4628 RepID=A0AAQ3KEE6_9LILI|nr:bifunctional epoxide hydrolase 2-like [Canna indica]